MKGIIIPLGAAAAAGVLGIVNIIPPFFAIILVLAILLCRDVVLMALMRGLPYSIVTQRIQGGIMWGVWNKTNTVKVGRFQPMAGTIQTQNHGLFNVMPDRIIKIDGVPFGFAPDGVGYNIGFDHALLIKELKKRGIDKVQDVADMGPHGEILGWKDDKRIEDLKTKFEFTPTPGEPLELSGFNDIYRYTREAANPYHMDARVKIGISQGLEGQQRSGPNWGLYILGIACVIGAVIALVVIFGGNEEIVVNVVSDAVPPPGAGPVVIPA
jgi:hypothetical protein